MSNIEGRQLPTHGIYPNISHDDYHAHPAVSKSGLDRLEQSRLTSAPIWTARTRTPTLSA